jgi:hypothetical protein
MNHRADLDPHALTGDVGSALHAANLFIRGTLPK